MVNTFKQRCTNRVVGLKSINFREFEPLIIYMCAQSSQKKVFFICKIKAEMVFFLNYTSK